MGQVMVTIGGRTYPVACKDGEEPHLERLAAGLSEKADQLSRHLGVMSESRLLLMTALMTADEAHEARRGNLPPPPPDDGRLRALVERVEALAARLSP
jgi:cell division protein ZapA